MSLLPTPADAAPAATAGLRPCLEVLPRLRRAPRRRSARWAVLASVLVHAVGIGVLWRVAVRPPVPPELEFRIAVASASAADDPEPVPESTAEPVTDLPDADVRAEPARPAEAPVPDDLPELEAAESAPLAMQVSVPSMSARTRSPARVEPPPPAPAPAPVPVAASAGAPPPRAAATSGAARVERASPLATNRRPAYPAASRARGEQGTVVLRLTLGADGSVTGVELERSSGFPLLDDAAVTAAWGWRFRPAVVDGTPVSSTARQRVGFRLDAS